MAVTLNKANLVLKDANGNIGKIEQLSSNDLAKIKTAMSDVALVVNQSNHTPIKATANTLGVVKPDGSTITVDSNGTLTATNIKHATSADSATNATNDSNGNNISNTYFPLIGGALRGNEITRNVTDNGLYVCGGTGWSTGSSIYIRGKDTENGKVTIDANNGTNFSRFEVGVGFCSFDNKNIVRSVNNVNADSVGNVTISTVTNATNATNATNDSVGRNIVNTYALKSNYPDRIKFAWDTIFKNYVNVTVDQTTWGLITNHNISSQSVNHATTADSATNATNATNLGGYPASNYIRSVNGITPDASGNVSIPDIEEIGNGYIRLKSGLQFCFSSASTTYPNVSFPKPFAQILVVVCGGNGNAYGWGTSNISSTGFTAISSNGDLDQYCYYLAVGYWK